MAHRRTAVPAALLVLAVPALTACSPAPEGEPAVARTTDGDLLVFVAPCHGVYHTVDLVQSGRLDEHVGSWHRKHVLLPGAAVNISDPARSKGWTTLIAWNGQLVPGDVYRVSLEGSPAEIGSYSLTIDSETVDFLRPGELLTRSHDGRGVQIREESVDDWSDRACDDSWF